jgi:hypothetical protein
MTSPEKSGTADSSYFERLRVSLDLPLRNLVNARRRAAESSDQLISALGGVDLPETTALVVFGSIARLECTAKSDVDWTLLVNGPADPEHFRLTVNIRNRFRQNGFESPGPTQMFGSLSSSHELLHHIGGDDDTNFNLTRRLLLLLESCALFGDLERLKVIRAILERYIVCGPGVPDPSHPTFRVPRFLLNDVVRLWRTIAVDYAAKKWQRADQGWALRNIKLRIPRKLTFVKGLNLCLDCELSQGLFPWTEVGDPEAGLVDERLVNGCTELVSLSPIDSLARLCLNLSAKNQAHELLTAYDDYLGLIDDDKARNHLEKSVSFEKAFDDSVFAKARDISQRFGNAMESLFFEAVLKLCDLINKYGVL